MILSFCIDTLKTVPGSAFIAFLIFLGRTSCPFVDNFAVAIFLLLIIVLRI